MKASLVVCVAGLALAPLVGAEVVEEETWYSAEGKVVKTGVAMAIPDVRVERTTLDSPDARRLIAALEAELTAIYPEEGLTISR